MNIIENYKDLNNFAKENYIIKGFINKNVCDRLKMSLSRYIKERDENYLRELGNWYYKVNKDKTQFFSFHFNKINDIEDIELRQDLFFCYNKLFDVYKFTGQLNSDEEFIDHISNAYSEKKTINPLIFFYPPGVGEFEWHQHPPTYQAHQLLINLTKVNSDYKNGETHIQLETGNEEIFDERFDQGDCFSFPYHLFHRVNKIDFANENSIGRISLLMPLHPRVGLKTYFKD